MGYVGVGKGSASPSRCQQGVLGRTSTDAVRGTTLFPYRGLIETAKVRRDESETWLWFQVCFIFIPIWGDDPILFDIFQMAKLPPKNDLFFQDCMRFVCESLSMSLEKKQFKMCVLCENHTGNFHNRRIVIMFGSWLTACLILKNRQMTSDY